jgi:hypothetical protein
MEKKTDRVTLGVVGCFLAFLVALVGTVVGVFVWLVPRARPAADAGADPAATAPPRRWEVLEAPPCPAPPGRETDGLLTEPWRVRDPARIDLAELHDQARPMALRLEPNAKLVSISALKLAAGGAFDGSEGNFSFNFEYRCLQQGAPPGEDLIEGVVLVLAQAGTLHASRVPVRPAPTLMFRGALPEPPCSTVAAWTTAVASGVPADARASFVYSEATGSVGGASWLITVPGHPYKREVDGQSCRLRAKSALHPELTDPGAPLPDLHPTALPASSAAPAASTSAPPPPVTDPAPPADEPHIGFAGGLEWERPVEAADMTSVDIGALFAQARVIAEKLQQGAQFTGLVAFDATNGKADLTGNARVVYSFEFVGQDPNQPPGKDTIERAIDVTAQRGKLKGNRRDWPASRLKHFGGAVEPPKCTSAEMWAVAVKSGVPGNAVSTIHYYDDTAFKPGGPWVWSVRVAGHDEHRREIDGKTCTMVKNWNPHPASASNDPSQAAPGGAAAAVCLLNINSIPPSTVAIDGRLVGTTPMVKTPVACGSHSVTFTHSEKGRTTVAVTATPDKVATVAVKF